MRRKIGMPALTLVTLTTFASCTNDRMPSEPGIATRRAVSAAQASGPVLIPNGVPYRNPEYKHATGRAGLASLSARALLNRDGTTDLEMTSGALDGSATDPIRRIQLKLLTPDQEQLRVQNHNGLTEPTFHTVLPDAVRGSFVQVQGNVEVANVTDKQNRTGVVTITERVNRRPDLAVTGIASPARAVVNTSVTFVGTVAELNDDLSARANCVFYVGGVEAARSEGIFVGEGDVVNCEMTRTFTDVGTYDVRLAVEGVSPGDWDLSNNAGSVPVEIFQPEYPLHGTASAEERHTYSRADEEYSYRFFSWQNRTGYNESTRNETSATFYGYAPTPLAFPATIAVVQSSSGTVQDEIVAQGAAVSGCLTASTTKSTARLCSDAGGTWLNVSRYSGSAVYYTWSQDQGGSCGFWGGCSNWGPYYYSSTSSSTSGGGFQSLNGDYRFEARAGGSGGEVFTADVSVPLTEFNGSFNSPRTCTTGFMSQTCNWGYSFWSGRQGSVIF